jgi:hypothetical protein
LGVAEMNHGGRQQADARMAVLVVVPLEKVLAEGAAVLDAAEMIRELGTILHGAELAFRVRSVVGNIGPAMALGDAQVGRSAVKKATGLELLRELVYSLQANRKTKEGESHPDRNAQLEDINRKVKRFLTARQPVISVDTKKKELVGDFRNGGQELRPQGDPEKVRVHDFLIPELGRATPYGVYDLAHNTGWVSVGVDHDTAAFAVESIRRWWQSMGKPVYPGAKQLLITADAGGSNGARVRLWKVELQKFADETGLRIAVCHLPPGTSKWNKIEHRLFSFITQNWRGKPLISFEVIVNLIATTSTTKGLQVHSELDTHTYPAGTKVPDKQLAQVRLKRNSTASGTMKFTPPARIWIGTALPNNSPDVGLP